MPANPANTQARIGFETNEGFGDPANWQDFRLLSESVGADIPTIEDESIISTAEQEEALDTKISPIGGDFNINWSPEDHAKHLANFFGAGATPVQAPTGVWTHKLAVGETDVSFGKVAVEISRDLDNRLASPVKRPDLFVGGLFGQLTFNAGPRSLLNGAATLVVPRFHHWRDPAVQTGTGTDPFIRGLPSYANMGSADGDVWISVTSAPGATMGIKVKLGSASTYDGTEITVTPGEWTTILDENDAQIGSVDLPVEIYFPDFTGINLADEWRVQRERAVWSPSLPDAAVLNEIAITILLDGTKFRTRDLSLTLTRPAEPDEAIGGRFLENDQINEFGQRTTSGQLNRRALDTSLVDRLLRREPFSLRVDAYSTFIGATGVQRQLSLIMMNCIPSGRTPSVGGVASFDEPIDFTAHPSDDVTYPAAVTAEIVNSQADLTA